METLDDAEVAALVARLETGERDAVTTTPRFRTPVHVVYGGAHLFRADTAKKLGARALESLDAFAPDVATFRAALGLDLDEASAASILERVRAKLEREPVEDFRIDFEDGFGPRTDAEEDEAATRAARELVKAHQGRSLPAFSGIRIKALDRSTRRRALRTLDRFVSEMFHASSGDVPQHFVVTLPKVTRPEEVRVLADAIRLLELKLAQHTPLFGIELMVETPDALVTPLGTLALPGLVRAARGRCTALHFGAYDYTSSLGVAAAHQSLSHPACVFARQLMRIAASQVGVAVSDGATNVLPLAVHRGPDLGEAQRADNRAGVHAAWRLHAVNVQRALREGFACGWDLHPAQLVPRYAAVYAHFASTFERDAARLRSFVDAAGKASLSGGVFDDAASALGLLNAFVGAVECGAASSGEVQSATGLTMSEIRGRDFAAIVAARAGGTTDRYV